MTGIAFGLAGWCLLMVAPAMAQNRTGSGPSHQPNRGQEAREQRAAWPMDLSSLRPANPFIHRLDSGLKFRGIQLYDRFYLARQKRGADSAARALGISYADDDILYYFSPELLSISFRY
jgi:hypothetical protein